MAARKRKVTLSDNWKDGIRASVLMRNLFDHANGEREMSQSQIAAAKIVLGKIVPDLSSTELTGNEEKPVIQRIERVILDPSAT